MSPAPKKQKFKLNNVIRIKALLAEDQKKIEASTTVSLAKQSKESINRMESALLAMDEKYRSRFLEKRVYKNFLYEIENNLFNLDASTESFFSDDCQLYINLVRNNIFDAVDAKRIIFNSQYRVGLAARVTQKVLNEFALSTKHRIELFDLLYHYPEHFDVLCETLANQNNQSLDCIAQLKETFMTLIQSGKHKVFTDLSTLLPTDNRPKDKQRIIRYALDHPTSGELIKSTLLSCNDTTKKNIVDLSKLFCQALGQENITIFIKLCQLLPSSCTKENKISFVRYLLGTATPINNVINILSDSSNEQKMAIVEKYQNDLFYFIDKEIDTQSTFYQDLLSNLGSSFGNFFIEFSKVNNLSRKEYENLFVELEEDEKIRTSLMDIVNLFKIEQSDDISIANQRLAYQYMKQISQLYQALPESDKVTEKTTLLSYALNHPESIELMKDIFLNMNDSGKEIVLSLGDLLCQSIDKKTTDTVVKLASLLSIDCTQENKEHFANSILSEKDYCNLLLKIFATFSDEERKYVIDECKENFLYAVKNGFFNNDFNPKVRHWFLSDKTQLLLQIAINEQLSHEKAIQFVSEYEQYAEPIALIADKFSSQNAKGSIPKLMLKSLTEDQDVIEEEKNKSSVLGATIK